MTVVVAYVPTDTGFRAVTEGVREARARDVPLVVVNAVGYAGYVAPTAADEKELDALNAYLAAQDVEHSLRQVSQVREKASVAGVVLDVAAETAAALIVLGLHRRSAIAKRVLGSTIQSVVMSASCPVLIVPAVDER